VNDILPGGKRFSRLRLQQILPIPLPRFTPHSDARKTRPLVGRGVLKMSFMARLTGKFGTHAAAFYAI
jgi:hypothetical protein